MDKVDYHHVSLRVRSAERAASFYETVFGYCEIKRHESQEGVKVLHLAQREGGPVLEIIQDGGPMLGTADAIHLGFSCADIDAVAGHLSELGVVIERGPSAIGCERLLFVRDLDGYLIEINDGL